MALPDGRQATNFRQKNKSWVRIRIDDMYNRSIDQHSKLYCNCIAIHVWIYTSQSLGALALFKFNWNSYRETGSALAQFGKHKSQRTNRLAKNGQNGATIHQMQPTLCTIELNIKARDTNILIISMSQKHQHQYVQVKCRKTRQTWRV